MQQKYSALSHTIRIWLSALIMMNSSTAIASNAFELLRFNEEWTEKSANDENKINLFWSKLKYMPLTDASWLTIGGEVRDRYESWNDYGFDAKQNDGFNLWRALAHANLHINSSLRAYVEMKSSLATARALPGGIRNADEDQFALQQGFIDVSPTKQQDLTFRLGRQQMIYGSQRLVAYGVWGNTMRTWDGLSVIKNTKQYKVSAFATQFVKVRQTLYNNSNADQRFYGIFATFNDMPIGADLYWLYLHNQDQRFLNPGTTALLTALDNRNTIGGRIFANKIFSYDLEMAYQFGRWGSRQVRAYFVAGSAEKSFKAYQFKPTLGLGFDVSSGGGGSDYSHTFNRLYAAGHRYLGHMDYIARQNITSCYIEMSSVLVNDLNLSIIYSYFLRSNINDAVYFADGSLLRAAVNNTAKAIGGDLDFTLQWKATPQANVLLGYSIFTPGEYIKTSGASSTSRFAYVQLQYLI